MPNHLLNEVMKSDGTNMVPLPAEYTTLYNQYGRYAPYMDYLTTNANHLRMQDLTLKYKVRNSFINKWGLRDLNIYIQGNNLFTIKASILNFYMVQCHLEGVSLQELRLH